MPENANELCAATEPFITVGPVHIDDRGSIENLLEGEFGSFQIIYSRAGSVRGNHRHRTDTHHLYLQSGHMVYAWRDDSGRIKQVHVTPGQMIYTPPGIDHAMRFDADSVMLCFARNRRDQDSYEADTIRSAFFGVVAPLV